MIRLFVGLVALSSVLAASAAEWVKIDGVEAHPTRVLAKLKPAQNVARLGVVAPDVKVKRTHSQIPQLLVIEPKAAAAVAAGADQAGAIKKTIKDLQATGMFEYVEPDYIVYGDLTPTDRRFVDGTLWGLQNTGQFGGIVGADINVTRAWDLTQGDTNMVVAVIDTGVNYNHQDLQAQMWRNPDEIPANNIDDDNNGIVDDVFGINSILDTGDPLDDHGHGSHTAGTIGAEANNGFEHVGVIWKVRIMALKFLGANNGGATSDAIQCINYAISKKAKLSNNSWGGYGRSQALFDAIDAARQQGHLFVAAAGNDSNDNDTIPAYPASFDLDNIISVAALDRLDQMAVFSNYGRTTVDIGAPGVEIFSTWMGPTNAYNTIQGTSMACPHVCGAAALSWSVDLTAPYSEIRDRLLESALPIPALAGKTTTGGRLNVFGAMGGNVDGILELSVVPPDGSYFGVGTSQRVEVKVRDAFNVNNATVVGRFNNQTFTFVNTGTPPDLATNDGVYTATIPMPVAPGTYSLSIDVTAPTKQPGHIDVNYLVLNPPSNDFFSRATKIPSPGGIREGDNRLATPEPGALPGSPNYGPDIGEPLHAGISNTRSLWWSWSTPTNTPVIVDTAGTSFDDDAVLGVYTGQTVSNLFEVGSAKATVNGPNGTRAPFVKFNAQPNLTYWIAVAQSQLGTNSPGQVILRVQPNGDIDTTPPTIQVTNFVSGTFYRSATNSIVLSGTANDPGPNASGVASIQVKGPNDLVFGTAIGTTNWSSGPIQLNPGLNIIEITGFDRADNQAQVLQFSITYFAQDLSNDLFGYSTSLTGNSGTIIGSNTNAAKEFGEPSHGGNEGGHSIWYNYRPTADGILFLSTEGSTFDTLLALYRVNDEEMDRSVSKLILVGQGDDVGANSFSEVIGAVEAGKLYYIAVDGYGGQTGTARLQYDLTPRASFAVTTTALPGGTISPAGTTLFPEGAAVTVTATPDRYKQLAAYYVTITNAQSGVVSSFVTNSPNFTFEVVGGSSITAEFANKVFTDDFEQGFTRLPWTIQGNWTTEVIINPLSGQQSRVARTANMGNSPAANSTASLILTNELAGQASFEFRVSSETNYDVAMFLINDQPAATWSGEVPWQVFTFNAPAGAKLEWRYTKDAALAVGADAFFIDNLDLPVKLPPPLVVNIDHTNQRITVSGPPATDVQLLTSTDLVTWTSAGEATTTPSGTASFSINFNSPQRFYKVQKL